MLPSVVALRAPVRSATKISTPVRPPQVFPELMRPRARQLRLPSLTGNSSVSHQAFVASALLRVACLRILGGRPPTTKSSTPVPSTPGFPELRTPRARQLRLLLLTGNSSPVCVASTPCGVCIVARYVFADSGSKGLRVFRKLQACRRHFQLYV